MTDRQPSPFGGPELLGEPERLLTSASELSPAVRSLLLSPPPVKPLDAQIAARVRNAVLQGSGAGAAAVKATALRSTEPLAMAKLGAVAAGAALFGAGVMTLVSAQLGAPANGFGGVTDRSGVVVVSATPAAQTSHRFEGRHGASSHETRASDATSAGEVGRGSNPGASEPRPAPGVAADDAARVRENTRSAAASGEAGNVSTASGVDSARGAGLASSSKLDRSGDAVYSVADLAAAEDDVFHASRGRSSASDRRVWVRPAFRHIASSETRESSTAKTRNEASAPPRVMSSLEEETLLLEEARSKLGRDPETALTLALEHQTRFRRGQLLEQRRMIHLEALLRLGRDKEASELAKSIGSSLYRARAAALLEKYGI